jgi:predicted RNase H-like nuclease
MQVVGVDSCRGGWLAVTYDTETGTLAPRAHLSFMALLESVPDAAAIAVDIPIALSERGPRLCDVAARKVLGPRRSSVFPAPDPRILFEQTWWEAERRSRKLTGKGVSQQTFAICRKVAEVNWAIQWEDQARVFEVHPEVCFWALAGRQPMAYRKTWPEGYDERLALLEAVFARPLWSREEARDLARPAAPDDLLDAVAAAWTVRRKVEGVAERLPAEPAVDRRGLRMEMVY